MDRKPKITMLVGLPRSGKSTWVNSNKEDALVVSSDWIRGNILGETYGYSESANAIVWTIMDSAVRIALGQGRDVVLDSANLAKETRSYYVAIGRKYGAHVKMVVFDTPFEVCLERNQSNGKKLPDSALFHMNLSTEWPYPEECDEIEVVKCE